VDIIEAFGISITEEFSEIRYKEKRLSTSGSAASHASSLRDSLGLFSISSVGGGKVVK
jgi:hypothetical protein